MNFLVVNKDLCKECKKCLQLCPQNAISVINNSISIDSDKCDVCGNCFKMCQNQAIKLSVPVAEIRKLQDDKIILDELKNSNEKLAIDYKILTEEVKFYKIMFTTLVSKLNEAVVIIDHKGKIEDTNSHFYNLLKKEDRAKYRSIKRVVGTLLSHYVTNDFFRHIITSQNTGKNIISIDTLVGGNVVSGYIYPINRGDSSIVIFREMKNVEIMADEIEKRLEDVIEHNLAMVQKLGFLVGEEISTTTNSLRQTINTLKISNSDKEE